MGRAGTLQLTVSLLVLAAAVTALREWQRRQEVPDGALHTRLGNGQVERCIACHQRQADSPGGAHSATAVGCAACHLGDAEAFVADQAHRGMEPQPGALDSVDRTCGRSDCHPDSAAKVRDSLMATGRGIIAVNRWVFGAQDTPDSSDDWSTLRADHPADDHLRRLCAGCHLGARRDNRDDAIETAAGSGCGACHYAPPDKPSKDGGQHGAIDGRVDDQRCFGCHSRSGRISLTYRGLYESTDHDSPECKDPVLTHDGRRLCRHQADVHRAAGMACIDCHLHTDLMGDGRSALHAEEAVEIRCVDCHSRGGQTTTMRWADTRDPAAARLLRLRESAPTDDSPARVGKRGSVLWNLRHNGAGWQLQPKLGGPPRNVRPTPIDANHQLQGHERLSCSACHSPWVPICGDCHTKFDADGSSWDFGVAAERPGLWRENVEHMGIGAPALALDSRRGIVPAIPGMVMQLEAGQGLEKKIRLYAALEPHSTQKTSRSCTSCHRSGFAVGLGTGDLRLLPGGPQFTPARDDGWVTLDQDDDGIATRVQIRSLSREERGRVIRVGLCVPCHAEASDGVYADFPAARARQRRGGVGCTGEVPQW